MAISKNLIVLALATLSPSVLGDVNINPNDYPPLDIVPTVNSTTVQGWLSELDLSDVPDLPQTVDGDPSQTKNYPTSTGCWWSYNLCTAPDDVVFCPNHDVWGLTYDDGPSPFTPSRLADLQSKNLTATFFIVGSRAVEYPSTLLTEYQAGHQLG